MIGRPSWLAAGVALGVGGTLWTQQRVRHAIERLAPGRAGDTVASVRDLSGRVRDALDKGRDAKTRREQELWDQLEERAPARSPRGVGARR